MTRSNPLIGMHQTECDPRDRCPGRLNPGAFRSLRFRGWSGLAGALLLALAGAVSLAGAGRVGAAEDAPADAAEAGEEPNELAPLAADVKVLTSHAPFESGECSLCHEKDDPQAPGPVQGEVNQLCLDCHDDFIEVLKRPTVHMPVEDSCGNCHNPHNSQFAKLLLEDPDTGCFSCHEDVQELTFDVAVKHEALTTGKKCANCHNPHAANVEYLLIGLAYDLCVQCHGQDGVADQDGKKLVNFKALLENNPEWHGPVLDKDCSSCHNPHGSPHFRLLIADYPAKFYAPYDPKLYALCFECHEESIVESPETTELTQFRNGSQNLHYLHVHKEERGRTCRACHEVHAAKQENFVRESVPYGSKGWMLKINFTRTPTGGTCTKTCHATKSYTNTVAAALSLPLPQADPGDDSPAGPVPGQ